jgi:hypothetical protein
MSIRRSYYVLAVLTRVILWLWAVSALVRMMIAMPDPAGWVCWVGSVALLIAFVGWGVARRLRTGRLPTDEEQKVALGNFVAVFWKLLGTAVIGACVAGFVLMVELNGLFNREAVNRAAGEHPVAFWATVGAGLVVGLAIESLKIAGAEPPPAAGGPATPPPGSPRGDPAGQKP